MGMIYRAVPKQTPDFTGLAATSSTTVLLAKGLDVSNFREVAVICRLHAATWPTGASVTISARYDAPTSEDTADFTSGDMGAMTFTQGTNTAPALKVFTVTSGFSAFIRIYVKGTTGSATGTFQPTLSVDVNARS